ncbi:globin domain-containing protein [Corynebacterium aquilae]|uniref:nitric oxide dioxygenase n=1 Tax=Corynebacterium aquilae DSM 44791 TaxID=1431546 RepID=A0A1L7CI43_9CORY|nr:globin domain-containing protein [Corynebacterium aquilae]APT85489.1 hemin transporter [Corynebacterium aquilae DSM 44791]
MHATTSPDTSRRLSEEHAAIVAETLPVIGAHINQITPIFYRTMFANHPELEKDLFNRGNQKDGDQQKALAASIAVFATMLVDPNAPDPVDMLARIGHKHVSLGVTREQYQIVHDNLFAAIVEVLGEAITPEVAAAWDEVYWIMADCLIDYEANLYDSAGVEHGDVFRTVTVTDKKSLPGGAIEITITGKLATPLPGQYTSLGVTLPDGARQLRQYSIIAGDDSTWTVALDVVGEVSKHLDQAVAVGDTIQATLPAGDLTLTPGNRPVVLISSGIGATPMVGMLNHLAAEASIRPVTYWHVDDDASTHALAAHTQAAIADNPHITFTPIYRQAGQRLTLSGDCGCGGTDCGKNLRDADVYLCGGTGFLQNMREQIAALPADQQPATVSYELFSPNDWLIR